MFLLLLLNHVLLLHFQLLLLFVILLLLLLVIGILHLVVLLLLKFNVHLAGTRWFGTAGCFRPLFLLVRNFQVLKIFVEAVGKHVGVLSAGGDLVSLMVSVDVS